MSERSKFGGVNSITFHQVFKTDADCLQYLSSLKWEDGYSCKRCKSDKYCQGKKPYNRRCTKCRYEESPTGRSVGAKKLIVVALEIVEVGVGRAYAEVIENASSKELGKFLKTYVSKDAKVISDEWRGYTPLKGEFKKLEQVASDDGKNFKDIHIHIMNIKSWLRGIHHHCSKERMQGYLNEYHFRYNRRQSMGVIFDLLIKKMVKNEPIRLISIT